MLFDPIVVSAEVGSDKTGTAIFERALGHLGVKPNESVFIDNSEDNLVAANALGMNTIHFNDQTNDLEALVRALVEQYGVRIPGTA